MKWLTVLALVYMATAKPDATHYSLFLDHTPRWHHQTFPTQFATATPNYSPFSNFLPQQPPPPPTTTPDPRTLGCEGNAPSSCQKTQFRSIDGSCNHVERPNLGVPQTRYNRLLPAKYGDQISNPPIALSGNDLPGSRLISLVMWPDSPKEDPKFTLNAMQYGQIITHDMSMTVGSTQTKPHQIQCCSPDGQLLALANIPEHCFPLVLPEDDPVHSKTNTKCINFVRTINDRDRECVGGSQPAEQLTAVNHYLDLSIIYGNDNQLLQQLRAFQGGRLTVVNRRGSQWPPQNSNVTGACSVQSQQEPCYQFGDARANQNPQLTLLHIIWLREHNRLADTLSKLNPHWDDERLFQEARRIAIAEHQFISYYEWLPLFIGLENSIKNKIVYPTKDFVNDYQASVDPTVLNEHANAAFRYFHSLIAGHLDLIDEHRRSYGNLRLSDWLNRPAIIEEGDNFDELARGLATQPEQAADEFHDSEITQFLFRNGRQFGTDLKALDIQRNRDHGLASYNDYRAFCGLPKAATFEGFLDNMSPETIKKLASLYETPDDVDLTVGGSFERHVPGTEAGPVFLCILTEQFFRTRVGDSFWFENQDNGLSLGQLNEIRKSSISRLLCDNAHHVQAMQPRGFQRISHENQITPCEALPSVNLLLWKEGSDSSVYNSNEAFGFTPDFSHEFFLKKK